MTNNIYEDYQNSLIDLEVENDIDIESVYEINEVYPLDSNYFYKTIEANSSDSGYYFSYFPQREFDVPIGAFSIETDESTTGSLTDVACTFVENDIDEKNMIEAIEKAIKENSSYCIGSQSKVNSKRYNYIFKYENGKKMVIKVSNGNSINGKFTLYMKTDENVNINKTDFDTLKEYGNDEDYKKSVIPYIVDILELRGDNETEYVSKVLFYSQYLELQMYYIPEDSNQPLKLFSGNILLIYTKPSLAIQVYHSTKLILLSEKLEGQEHSSLGNSFRFHTKMFLSKAQIQLVESQNPDGRTLNFPLSLEMNTCSEGNNKLYYILNYNRPESQRTLHLDLIFGSYIKARIAKKINATNWDLLIDNNMEEINNYQTDLPEESQHIDVIEIQCETPLLLNAYYTDNNYIYKDLKKGEIVVKELPAISSFSFSISNDSSGFFFYSISSFNSIEPPSITVQFPDGSEHYISDNSLHGYLLFTYPDKVTVINNSKTKTRFIFKIGFSVEGSEDWKEVEDSQNLEGTLYSNTNKYIYKFPIQGNRRNFTKISFLVTPKNESENIKFCYTTNLGISIEASKENCFITGTNIPYTLTFINPLIIGKNYKDYTNGYYISFAPFKETDFINIEITEEKYDNLNRNEDGVAKLLTLVNQKAGTILSLPNQEASKILVQLKSCGSHSNPIQYVNYNAFTKEELNSGKIYEPDKFGIYYITTNIYLENYVELTGLETGVSIFTKHTSLCGNYIPSIQDYKVTFDSSLNAASIIKPIYDEDFEITVIVGPKGTLDLISLCHLAFKDKSKFGDYSVTFTSESSNIITHFIDFKTFQYSEGTEFDLLVYAKQINNSKMEFIYPLINGKVGEIINIIKIDTFVEGENEYVYKDFSLNPSGNYLYYDFGRKPTGNIASLRILIDETKVNKVGCTFVPSSANDEEMVSTVNKAVLEGKNTCIGEMGRDYSYDALINSNFEADKYRLVIQVLYELGEEKLMGDEEVLKIYLKITGSSLRDEGNYKKSEDYTAIPYVIDLLELRNSKVGTDYISKILFYSNTREMQMFYIDENEAAPVSLFTGNILLVYTNEELIKQKYHGALTMILVTDTLSRTRISIIGERIRFMTKFFNSAANIHYFLSNNIKGRPLNTPTAIEMTSCIQPYYYIFNYNQIEEKRILYIDSIFGEKSSIKMTNSLIDDEWDTLISNMKEVNGNEIILEKTKHHFDIMEVNCNLPLLLNLYYIDPENQTFFGLEIGDISIITLNKAEEKELQLKTGYNFPVYSYTFNVLEKKNQKPNIEIVFNQENYLEIKEYGVYPKNSIGGYDNIVIRNKDDSNNDNITIIFKYGYSIENTFKRNENGIYSNEKDEYRTKNLYGYIYDNSKSKLNFTGVNFRVETNEDNVKFCYNTNLGTYLDPSLQNCYRVGKNNPYTIETLNPLVMYKNYKSEEELIYYIGFYTVELNQNINIIPILRKYDTNERNIEGINNVVTIGYERNCSTILTAPKNNEQYIFTYLNVCSKDKSLSYEFLNAYNYTNLGFDGEIEQNSKFHYVSINNIKIDTELKLYGDEGVKIYIKHTGIDEKYDPIISDIIINFDNNTRLLSWTQPIEDQEFIYTIYIDKIDTLKNKSYTLCDIVEISKIGPIFYKVTTDSKTPSIVLTDLGNEYKYFDVIIVAEQTNKGKVTILSDVYDFNEEEEPVIPEEEESTIPEEESTIPEEEESTIPEEEESSTPEEEEHNRPEEEEQQPDEEESSKEEEEEENSSDKGDDSSDSTLLIVLLSVFGSLIIIGIIVGVLFYLKNKTNKNSNNKDRSTSLELIQNSKSNEFAGSEARDTNIDP